MCIYLASVICHSVQHHAYFKVDLVHFSFKTFNVFKNLLSREEQGLCFSASSDNFCVYTVSDIQTEDGRKYPGNLDSFQYFLLSEDT